MGGGVVRTVAVAGDPGGVFAALCAGYRVLAETSETLHWTWLDTADWRLRRAGLGLREERQGRSRTLVLEGPDGDGEGAATDTVIDHATVSRVSWPALLEELEPSPLRERLAAVVRVRALLPVAEVETRRIPLRLLDELDKTRVLVSVDQQRLLTPRRASLPLHVTAAALRGYDEDAQRCVALLADAMPTDEITAAPPDAALAAAGRLPGTRALEPVTLEPGDAITRAFALGLRDPAEAVARTLDGVLADLDSEFLHDLRDATHGSLALLDAAGGRLPGQTPVSAATQFARLDAATAPLRAVDLALQRLDPAQDLAPRSRPDLRGLDHLDPLRDMLRSRRRVELRKLRRTLTPDGMRELREQWPPAIAAVADEDALGPTVAQSAPLLLSRALAAVPAGITGDVPGGDTSPAPGGVRVDVVRRAARTLHEVLHALLPALTRSPSRALADLDEILALAVGVGRLQVSAVQVRHAVDTGRLPIDTVLDTGAWLDRADRLETDTLDRLDRRLGRFASPKSRHRLDAVLADIGADALSADARPFVRITESVGARA